MFLFFPACFFAESEYLRHDFPFSWANVWTPRKNLGALLASVPKQGGSDGVYAAPLPEGVHGEGR